MAAALPPVPLKDIAHLPYTFQEWLRKIQQLLATAGIPWTLIDFTGSDLADIATRNHNDLQNIQGGSAAEYYHLTSAQNTQVVNFVETAQDAVGAMVDSTLVYVDATPLLTRAALTGDITAPQASNATTLATVNSNVGTFGSATQVAQVTVNGKGLVTAASNVSISANATTVTVANETTDTTCFPLFVTAATGDLGPKSSANLTFNSNLSDLVTGMFHGIGSGVNPVSTVSQFGGGSIGAQGTSFLVTGSAASNSRIADVTKTTTGITYRFINDGYSGATNYLVVVGSSASVTSITVPTLTNSALTSGRVTIAGASGLLADSASLTFNTGTTTLGTVNITATGALQVDGNSTLGNAAADTVTVTGTPAGQIIGSTYTPTRSAEANMDANVTMSQAQYMRVGATVTVSGTFTADPTITATVTSFELSLPVASNIGAIEDAAGVAFCGAIAGMGAQITGVIANDTAKVSWISTDVTSQTWSYTFTYQII